MSRLGPVTRFALAAGITLIAWDLFTVFSAHGQVRVFAAAALAVGVCVGVFAVLVPVFRRLPWESLIGGIAITQFFR